MIVFFFVVSIFVVDFSQFASNIFFLFLFTAFLLISSYVCFACKTTPLLLLRIIIRTCMQHILFCFFKSFCFFY